MNTETDSDRYRQNANVIPVAMQVMNQAFRNPILLSDLQTEIAKCQTGPTSFNIDKLTSQSKLKSVFLEALRWATASPSPRIVKEDCELGGYTLKSGSMLIVHARTLQMEDDTWRIPGVPESDPENFWPERFMDGDEALEAERANENHEAEINYVADTAKDNNTSAAEKRKFQEPLSGPKSKDIQQRMQALRPFGGGTSMCPGRFFSSNEVIGGLAALLLRLEVEVIDEELRKNGVPMPNLIKQGGLFPDRPLMVRMRQRAI
jgi:cytochrome P450